MNNGGLTHVDKNGMCNAGVHQRRFNNFSTKVDEVRKSRSPPHREASTFYYASDGTGRDSYVLMDNGGLRPEYEKYNKSP